MGSLTAGYSLPFRDSQPVPGWGGGRTGTPGMGGRLHLNHAIPAFALCSFKVVTYDFFDLLLIVYYSWRSLIKLTQSV